MSTGKLARPCRLRSPWLKPLLLSCAALAGGALRMPCAHAHGLASLRAGIRPTGDEATPVISEAVIERSAEDRVSLGLPRGPLREAASSGRPAQLMQDMSKIIGVTNGSVWLAWHISY